MIFKAACEMTLKKNEKGCFYKGSPLHVRNRAYWQGWLARERVGRQNFRRKRQLRGRSCRVIQSHARGTSEHEEKERGTSAVGPRGSRSVEGLDRLLWYRWHRKKKHAESSLEECWTDWQEKQTIWKGALQADQDSFHQRE